MPKRFDARPKPTFLGDFDPKWPGDKPTGISESSLKSWVYEVVICKYVDGTPFYQLKATWPGGNFASSVRLPPILVMPDRPTYQGDDEIRHNKVLSLIHNQEPPVDIYQLEWHVDYDTEWVDHFSDFGPRPRKETLFHIIGRLADAQLVELTPEGLYPTVPN